MILQKIVIFILAIFSFNNCCSSDTVSSQKNDVSIYKSIAEQEFGSNYKEIFNSDSSYLIVTSPSNKTTTGLNSPLKFFVFNLSENKIVFRENLPNGNIKWINDRQVKVSTEPGIISGKEDKNSTGYTYDVILKRKILNEGKFRNNK
jgi:hypothetical protein